MLLLIVQDKEIKLGSSQTLIFLLPLLHTWEQGYHVLFQLGILLFLLRYHHTKLVVLQFSLIPRPFSLPSFDACSM